MVSAEKAETDLLTSPRSLHHSWSDYPAGWNRQWRLPPALPAWGTSTLLWDARTAWAGGLMLIGCALTPSCSATSAAAPLLVAPIATALLSPRAAIGTGARLVDRNHPSLQLCLVQSLDRG
jgi:hypothetical protein